MASTASKLPTFRTTIRTTLLLGTITATAHQTQKHFSLRHTIHAEQPPSDTTATLKKIPWSGFTTLKLESSEMINHNVKKLTFALPENDSISGLETITSLLTQHTPEGAWIPVFRPYTPISAGTDAGKITFLIKKYPDGKGSGKMHSLVPGDSMKFKPIHEFDYKPNVYNSILVIAGGSGITPIYQLTNAILSNPQDRTKITLVYANNTEQDILLRDEFEALERKHPGRFTKVFTVKNGDVGAAGVEKGYVTKEMISGVWPGRKAGQKVLVSGPPAMTENIAGKKGGFGWTQGSIGGLLKELGYTKEEVHKF